MVSQILHSIMHGELMPWSIDSKGKAIAEKLKTLGAREPQQVNELTQQIKSLVSDLPELTAWLNKNYVGSSEKLFDLLFSTELPPYYNTITKFYSLLISKEAIRVFNEYLSRSANWTNNIDLIYHTTTLLRSIKTLTKQTGAELIQRGFDGLPDSETDHIHYTLYFLKQSLIALYFSIQEVHKDRLEEIISLEDFYLLELNEPISGIRKIYPAQDKILVGSDNTRTKESKINFGFKGKPEDLKTIISQLNFSVDILNEPASSPETLISVLTSKNLIPGSAEIHLKCETAVFRYIIDGLKPSFSNLKLTTIQNSKVFYSKNGTLLTAQNLSSSKIENPKSKTEIDRIFNQMK
jgi:hypothetical protein